MWEWVWAWWRGFEYSIGVVGTVAAPRACAVCGWRVVGAAAATLIDMFLARPSRVVMMSPRAWPGGFVHRVRFSREVRGRRRSEVGGTGVAGGGAPGAVCCAIIAMFAGTRCSVLWWIHLQNATRGSAALYAMGSFIIVVCLLRHSL